MMDISTNLMPLYVELYNTQAPVQIDFAFVLTLLFLSLSFV